VGKKKSGAKGLNVGDQLNAPPVGSRVAWDAEGPNKRGPYFGTVLSEVDDLGFFDVAQDSFDGEDQRRTRISCGSVKLLDPDDPEHAQGFRSRAAAEDEEDVRDLIHTSVDDLRSTLDLADKDGSLPSERWLTAIEAGIREELGESKRTSVLCLLERYRRRAVCGICKKYARAMACGHDCCAKCKAKCKGEQACKLQNLPSLGVEAHIVGDAGVQVLPPEKQGAEDVVLAAPRGKGAKEFMEYLQRGTVDEHAAEIGKYWSLAKERVHQGAACMLLIGLELHAVRQRIAHGNKGHGGGGWQKWIEANCEFSYISAYKWMEAASRKLATVGAIAGIKNFALGTSPTELNPKERLQLTAAVQKLAGDKTARQLMLELGLQTQSKTKGGFHPGKEHLEQYAKDHDLAPHYEAWPAAVQRAFRKWLAEQEAEADRKARAGLDPKEAERMRRERAALECDAILQDMRRAWGGEDPNWAYLEVAKRRELRDDLVELSKRLTASLKAER